MNDALYFLVSGDHPELGAAEVRAILEAEGFRYSLVEQKPKLLVVKAPTDCLSRVGQRSLMCEACGLQIFRCQPEHEAIKSTARRQDFSKFLLPRERFLVRVTRVAGFRKNLRGDRLESDLGAIIKEDSPLSSADMKRPDKVFQGVITRDAFSFGLTLHTRQSGIVASHRPRMRAAFHPSTMQPKLARCMVNLSRSRSGTTFLDPFSGIGGILIEAGPTGATIVGADIKRKMVKGCIANLSFFKVECDGVLVADARKLPFTKVDAIATDPPYGTSSTLMGLKVPQLLKAFMENLYPIMTSGGFVCIAVPHQIAIDELAQETGFQRVEEYTVRVHRSLTRRITVLRRG